MVDFATLRNGNQEPREIDYLAYLVDEFKLTEWEENFSKSCINHLRTKYQRLTQKQRAVLDKLIAKHAIKTEHAGYCVKGYADREDQEVMNNIGPGTSIKMAQAIHDMDDDIPF